MQSRSLLGLVIMGCLALPSPAFCGDSEEGLTIIRAMHLGNNLGQLARMSIETMPGYKTMVDKFGKTKTQDIVDYEMNTIQPKYQDEWDKNLTSAYLEYFTIEELRSIYKKKWFSPYADKVNAEQKNVAQSMRKKSSGILAKMVTEVMEKSLKDSTKPNS